MIEDLGERQDTGIYATRTRSSAGQNHYTTYRLRRSKDMEKKSCDNCGRKAECRYPGRPCWYWIEKQMTATECRTSMDRLFSTMRKLDAMIREELR